jgi:hypothetical protein
MVVTLRCIHARIALALEAALHDGAVWQGDAFALVAGAVRVNVTSSPQRSRTPAITATDFTIFLQAYFLISIIQVVGVLRHALTFSE